MELHTISSYGSGEGPLLPHWVSPAALLPQELPQVREEAVPFPGSKPQGGRLPGHCSEEEALLAQQDSWWPYQMWVAILNGGGHVALARNSERWPNTPGQ